MLGKGTIKAMWVTLRHTLETYLHRGDQTPTTKGLFTIQYPEERLPLPERYRNTPILLAEETGELRCTACGMCARVCPPQCIWITRATDEAGKPQRRPQTFVIDTSICMGCGFCAEFCPFDAIRMDHDYELAASDRWRDLVLDMEQLQRPTSYYAQINPTAWAAEQEAKAAKARPKPAAKKEGSES